MKKLAFALLMTLATTAGVITQQQSGSTFKPDTIELITPWIYDAPKTSFSNERFLRSCFNFVSLSHGCERYPGVSYGDRIGVNWDLFQIEGGQTARTRMVDVGKYEWTDKFVVPNVEAWPGLLPGEKRAITFNASGANGASGAPGQRGEDGVAGMNGDGTYTPMPLPQKVKVSEQPRLTGKSYATANVTEQVSSTIKGADGKVRNSAYTPVVEVKLGHMYAVHVLDQDRDFYVLIHVDDVVHGENVKLSFIKILIGPL